MRKNEASIIIFISFACLVILYHLFGYFGHFGYDDMLYARIAKNLVDGQVNFENAFSYRFTIITLTALSYLIFGVNDPASALPSILVSISVLYIIYTFLKKLGTLQTILGLSFTVSVNAFLFYTDKIMPDIYVALFLLLAVYFYYRYRFTFSKSVILCASLFSLSLFLAFNSKETAVLFLPLPVAFFFIDLINGRNLRFWVFAIISGLLIMAIYLLLIKVLTGSFFTRFDILIDNHHKQTFMYSYDKLHVNQLLKRIFYEQFYMYLKEGVLVPFILIVSVLFSSDFKRIFNINEPASFFTFSSLLLLLSINFMTISPFSYHPVPIDPRHSLFIIPIAAIAASYVLREYLVGKRYQNSLLVILIIVSLIALFVDKTSAYYLYLPITFLFLTFAFLRNKKRYTIVFVVLFILVLFIKPFLFFHHSITNVKYRMQKKIVYEFFINSNEPCYVFTDPVQKSFCDYYTGFDTTNHCRFVDFTKIKRDTFDPAKNKFLFLNWHTQYCSKSYDKLPYFAQYIDSTYTLLFENREHSIFLYKLQKIIIPEFHFEKVYNTKNDFHKDYKYWTPINTDILYSMRSGNRVSKPGEYSAVFSIPLDTLIDVDTGNLFVKCLLRGYFKSVPTSILVVSVEDQNGTVFWKGKELSKEVFNIRQWVNVNYEITIEKEDIQPKGSLNIYLWNPQFDVMYIDDFEIIIYNTNSL